MKLITSESEAKVPEENAVLISAEKNSAMKTIIAIQNKMTT